MQYSQEVENMCPVAKGAYHGPAPIPEEGKWVKAKEISDISGLTHGVGWCPLKTGELDEPESQDTMAQQQPEAVRTQQPELPVLKNSDQRKTWLNDYQAWRMKAFHIPKRQAQHNSGKNHINNHAYPKKVLNYRILHYKFQVLQIF